MMIEILHYIPVLGVAILINIVLGLYNSLGTLELKFDWKKLVGGILNIVFISFFGILSGILILVAGILALIRK